MQSLLILGRQPALGLAELESLYGADKIRLVGDKTAIIDVDPCLLAFDRLGGSLKFCKLLTSQATTNWKQLEKFLVQVAPGFSERMPEGKMRLGLSTIGFNVPLKQLEATGLTIKKAIKKTGRNVRLIPNKSAELNTAQVLHNQLTGPTGWELVFIRDGNETIIAQTVKVQDIQSYTKRDRERPKRDTKVGMLPPKLAQIIINLAVGELPEEARQSVCEIPPDEPIPPQHFDSKILDPFCGTGVLLQEAYLMGYGIYGTDIDQRMVNYSKENVGWLVDYFNPSGRNSRFETADATSYRWPHEFDVIASEAYLGRPFTSLPTPEILAQTMAECNLIIKKFLQNIHPQIKSGTRLCLAIPAWHINVQPNQSRRPRESGDPDKNTEFSSISGSRIKLGMIQTGKAIQQTINYKSTFKHLPLVDQISDLGYNRVSFEHLRDEDLIYYRDDQIVARQLLVLTKQ